MKKNPFPFQLSVLNFLPLLFRLSAMFPQFPVSLYFSRNCSLLGQLGPHCLKAETKEPPWALDSFCHSPSRQGERKGEKQDLIYRNSSSSLAPIFNLVFCSNFAEEKNPRQEPEPEMERGKRGDPKEARRKPSQAVGRPGNMTRFQIRRMTFH